MRALELGFSDRAVVFLNGRALYRGDDTYRSRDYRFLGSIGYYDTLFLPLVAGVNDLVIAVSEDFGGWGVQARLAGLTGGPPALPSRQGPRKRRCFASGGRRTGSREQPEEIERGSARVPVRAAAARRPPFADAQEKALAVLRVIEQAERERARRPDDSAG